MNTALVIAKEVAKAASNFGIGYMGGAVGKALTPDDARKIVKVCVYVGSCAASGAIAMKANDYIDETAEAIDEAVKGIKEAVKKEKKSPEKTEEKVKNTVVDIIEDIEKKEKKPKKKEDKKTKETKVEKTEEA